MSNLDTAPAKLCGLILAGGQSTRLGRDKAMLKLGGKTQLDRTASLLRACIDEIYVSLRVSQATEALRQVYAVIVDEYQDMGPAAGILSAHRLRPDAAWLVVACDMPLVDETTIRSLIEERDCSKAATAYISPADGLPEPLCTIYEPGTLARFKDLAGRGSEASPRSILTQSDLRLLELPRRNALESVNTPEDLARVSRLMN